MIFKSLMRIMMQYQLNPCKYFDFQFEKKLFMDLKQ